MLQELSNNFNYAVNMAKEGVQLKESFQNAMDKMGDDLRAYVIDTCKSIQKETATALLCGFLVAHPVGGAMANVAWNVASKAVMPMASSFVVNGIYGVGAGLVSKTGTFVKDMLKGPENN